MLTYVIKRMFAMIPTLFGISLVTFLIVLMAPGDPVASKMGQGGGRQATEGGSGDAGGRKGDAIKAKKKLLGMLEEHRTLMAWDGHAAAASRDWMPTDKYKTVDELRETAAIGELQNWAHAVVRAPGEGNVELFVGDKKGAVFAIDGGTGAIVRTFTPHATGVTAIAISRDGGTLITADGEGSLRVHDAQSGAEIASGDSLRLPVRDLAFLPDGERFLSACNDGVIRLHATATARVEKQFSDHNNYVAALAVSDDGARFWSGGYDRKLREWSTATWKSTRTVGSHNQPINALTLSADGALLASACDDNSVRVFDADTGSTSATLMGHFGAVTAVAFHPDGRTLFSGSRDETIRTWDIETERQTAQAPENTGRVYGLAVASDGSMLWSAADSWRKTPAIKQYWTWLSKTARGDFGRSFTDNKPVMDKIKERLPVTLGLNALAFVLIYLVSIPLGVQAAVKRGGLFDNITSGFVFMLWSLPNFFLATILIMYLSSERHLSLFPSVGLHSSNHADMSYLTWLWDFGMHLVLPTIVLTYGGFASLSRFARASMLDTIQQDFIRTARAKGLSEFIVVYKHTLRNSLIAIVTLIGNLLPAMIGGSVIVEFIFSIRGMGLLGFEAILSRDYPVVMAVTTFSALLTLVGVLISDILYSVVDPRISHG